jgi:hypothetical protein
MAVTKPTVKAPNQSKWRNAARRIPDMANAIVPITSIAVKNVDSIYLIYLFTYWGAFAPKYF